MATQILEDMLKAQAVKRLDYWSEYNPSAKLRMVMTSLGVYEIQVWSNEKRKWFVVELVNQYDYSVKGK